MRISYIKDNEYHSGKIVAKAKRSFKEASFYVIIQDDYHSPKLECVPFEKCITERQYRRGLGYTEVGSIYLTRDDLVDIPTLEMNGL